MLLSAKPHRRDYSTWRGWNSHRAFEVTAIDPFAVVHRAGSVSEKPPSVFASGSVEDERCLLEQVLPADEHLAGSTCAGDAVVEQSGS